MLCDDLEELDGKGGRETQEGEDICSPIAEIYAVVYQKLTQHRKAIVLQFKKNCTYHVPVLSSIFFFSFCFCQTVVFIFFPLMSRHKPQESKACIPMTKSQGLSR